MESTKTLYSPYYKHVNDVTFFSNYVSLKILKLFTFILITETTFIKLFTEIKNSIEKNTVKPLRLE